jgi:hypothetical protein
LYIFAVLGENDLFSRLDYLQGNAPVLKMLLEAGSNIFTLNTAGVYVKKTTELSP